MTFESNLCFDIIYSVMSSEFSQCFAILVDIYPNEKNVKDLIFKKGHTRIEGIRCPTSFKMCILGKYICDVAILHS